MKIVFSIVPVPEAKMALSRLSCAKFGFKMVIRKIYVVCDKKVAPSAMKRVNVPFCNRADEDKRPSENSGAGSFPPGSESTGTEKFSLSSGISA